MYLIFYTFTDFIYLNNVRKKKKILKLNNREKNFLSIKKKKFVCKKKQESFLRKVERMYFEDFTNILKL